MPRRPKRIFERKGIPENIWKFLNDDLPNPFDDFDIFVLSDEAVQKLWNESEEEILSNWISGNPGTRPSLWWKYDFPEPRQRIGGIGTPSHEVLAVEACYEFGLPTSWISEFEERHHFETCKGKAIDFNDPPLFESQTAYLQRHGLLISSEEKYLLRHPELFEPEKINL